MKVQTTGANQMTAGYIINASGGRGLPPGGQRVLTQKEKLKDNKTNNKKQNKPQKTLN